MEPIYSPPQTPFLEILHQDEHMLAINKQSGLLSVPGRLPEKKDSIQLRAQSLHPTALTVHRLDMETSGVIVMALGEEMHRALSRLFQDRETQKTYLARVGGTINQQEGTIDLPLRCDWPNRPRQIVDHDLGKPAQTHWRVLNCGPDETLVELTPVTGRSHQLRVHMLSLGHPILGDSLYAPDELKKKVPHLQLHAHRLSFIHPATGKRIAFTAPCPF
ncbi:ribosomal large subunit pseudouridine synthase A [Aestuariispira insulae]|uniref:Dual-specificity RNA pseudouridine synthase RluA n=2 Tax=Aestuariispira insulae TaxID=1461337 RepID=A0A3D9HW98_9PROT|nr:ribosomal large subunit pseudouridine synthase A [Aestuariispira insulae]